jgi:hypothetical protein
MEGGGRRGRRTEGAPLVCARVRPPTAHFVTIIVGFLWRGVTGVVSHPCLAFRAGDPCDRRCRVHVSSVCLPTRNSPLPVLRPLPLHTLSHSLLRFYYSTVVELVTMRSVVSGLWAPCLCCGP